MNTNSSLNPNMNTSTGLGGSNTNSLGYNNTLSNNTMNNVPTTNSTPMDTRSGLGGNNVNSVGTTGLHSGLGTGNSMGNMGGSTTTSTINASNLGSKEALAATKTSSEVLRNIPLNSVTGNINGSATTPELLVQNHPDTVNNNGKGHNNNKGKIEVASLNPVNPTNMNTNPSAPTLSNVATTTHTIPKAPVGTNNNSSNTGLLGRNQHDYNNYTADDHTATSGHHSKVGQEAHKAKDTAKSILGHNNIVASFPAATHLGGNPGMSTNTNINNTGLGNTGHLGTSGTNNHHMGTTTSSVKSALGLNKNIGDQINTNPVATNHPHANVPNGDIHTNQLVNNDHHIGGGNHKSDVLAAKTGLGNNVSGTTKEHQGFFSKLFHKDHNNTNENNTNLQGNSMDKHNNLNNDTTTMKETPQYH